MVKGREIVITGMGLVSPIGIGAEAYWNSLSEQKSGIRLLDYYDNPDLPQTIGGTVEDFEPKKMVRPRKSLKVMSRSIQLGFAAADQAIASANFETDSIDPERIGIVYGADMIAVALEELRDAYAKCIQNGPFDYTHWGAEAMDEMYPLWMLKYLPNMTACHVGIAHDMRGPNNTITMAETSSLSAISEAADVIRRGQADIMVAGGGASWIHENIWSFEKSYTLADRTDNPSKALRPFDLDRTGTIHGEGGGAFILEELSAAQSRGAKIYGRIVSVASRFEPVAKGEAATGKAIRLAIKGALEQAGLKPEDIDHVNADGLSTPEDDRLEAAAIHDTLGDVRVTAPRSFIGNLYAGAGAVELGASLLAFEKGEVPVTLNYEKPDPTCPVNVVHGEPAKVQTGYFLKLNVLRKTRAIAMVVAVS
jgi:3-oxoacyl-[acyl-carrier-protein] synthase II